MKRGASASSDGPAGKKKHSSSAQPPGGYKQKLAWAADQDTKDNAPSALAALLLQRWAWGEFSVPQIQQIAEAALAYGLAHADLKQFGTPSISRHLQDKLQPIPIRSALCTMMVHVVKPKGGIVQTRQSMLLPHELFSCLHTHHHEEFVEKLCGGDTNNIKKFWSSMKHHPVYAEHPLHHRSNHVDECIPIALHGDGVAVAGISKSWSKSVDAYSWTSLLSRGSTITTHFMISILYWRLVVQVDGMNMWDAFNKKLAWSFYWLFVGKWPTRDEHHREYAPDSPQGRLAGTPLAGGYYGCLWMLRGDLEHMAKAYGFAWPTAAEPCSCCRANASDLPWTDGRMEALWRGSIWTNAAWLLAHPDRNAIFHLPGMGILAFVPDFMHTVHLGCYMYLFGSLLQLLTHEVMGGTRQANLDEIWQLIQKDYKNIGESARWNYRIQGFSLAGHTQSLLVSLCI